MSGLIAVWNRRQQKEHWLQTVPESTSGDPLLSVSASEQSGKVTPGEAVSGAPADVWRRISFACLLRCQEAQNSALAALKMSDESSGEIKKNKKKLGVEASG